MRLLPVLCALALLLPACDADGADAAPAGTFEATVTGDVEARLSGTAAFQRRAFEPGAPATVAVTMIEGAGAVGLRTLGIVDPQGTFSGTGTYALAPTERSLGLLYTDFTGGPTLAATAGAVRVTTFSDDLIVGTFEAELAEAFAEGPGVTARVEGSFTARALPVR